MSSGEYPVGYGMPTPVEAYTEGWPSFAQGWYGGEFPVGRGQRTPEPGWVCPGCSRGYSPKVFQCGFCGPAGSPPQVRDLTWSPDAPEPDET